MQDDRFSAAIGPLVDIAIIQLSDGAWIYDGDTTKKRFSNQGNAKRAALIHYDMHPATHVGKNIRVHINGEKRVRIHFTMRPHPRAPKAKLIYIPR